MTCSNNFNAMGLIHCLGVMQRYSWVLSIELLLRPKSILGFHWLIIGCFWHYEIYRILKNLLLHCCLYIWLDPFQTWKENNERKMMSKSSHLFNFRELWLVVLSNVCGVFNFLIRELDSWVTFNKSFRVWIIVNGS